MDNYSSQRVSRHSFYTCSLSFAFQDKASGPFILKVYLTIYCIMNTYSMTRSCSPPRAVVPSHLMPPVYPRIEEGKVHRARHLFGQPTSQILSTLHIRYLSTTLVTWNLVSSPRFQSVSAFTIFSYLIADAMLPVFSMYGLRIHLNCYVFVIIFMDCRWCCFTDWIVV
jgi:hypothetical protein